MKPMVRYVWQIYSEAEDRFYDPLVPDLLRHSQGETTLELKFHSADDAKDFKEKYPYGHKDEWILCKMTTEIANETN